MTADAVVPSNGAVGDRELVERCARRDRKAWSELVRLHGRPLLRVLSRASRGIPAEDLADLRQEVWVRVWERDALAGLRLERPGALFAFLARVAVRIAFDYRRARRERRLQWPEDGTATQPDPEDGTATQPDPEAVAIDTECRAQLASALVHVANGPNGPRDLLVLRAHLHRGLGPAEIAAMGIGLSCKGVETLLRRARQKLSNDLRREPSRIAVVRNPSAVLGPARATSDVRNQGGNPGTPPQGRWQGFPAAGPTERGPAGRRAAGIRPRAS